MSSHGKRDRRGQWEPCEAWKAALNQKWWPGLVLVVESLIQDPNKIKEEILKTQLPCWDLGEVQARTPQDSPAQAASPHLGAQNPDL